MLAVGIAGGVVFYRWINAPSVQQSAMQWISEHTPWEVTLGGLEWNAWQSQITIRELSLTNRRNNHHVALSRLAIHYSPWALFRATLRFRSLEVDSLTLRSQQMPSPKSKRKRIELSKLLILRNLEIDSGVINNVTALLPNERTVSADSLHFRFDPEFLGDVQLDIELIQPAMLRGETPEVEVEELTLSGTTDIGSWVNYAPYINDVRGSLTVTKARWRSLEVSDLAAVAYFNNSRIGLDGFEAQIGDRVLRGSGFVDLSKERSALHLEWPDPMPIPELLHDSSFIRTAGTLQGSIDWEGKALRPDKLTGSMKVDLTHVPAETTDIPGHLVVDGKWQEGRFQIGSGTLHVGESRTTVTGSLDLNKKHIAIDFQGEQVPILGVLGRFRNPDFHPVTGKASVKGRFTGWARDYLLELSAKTEGGGSYLGINLEAVQMSMRLTYPQLNLQGQILQEGRQTGNLEVVARYGAKDADGKRPSTLALTAQLNDHRLDPSFQEIDLKGIGQGTITINGPSTAYRGSAELEIRDGSFSVLPIESLKTKLALRPKEITFQPSELKIANVPAITWPQPLVMHIDQGFRLKGNPTTGLSIDLSYASADKSWTFHNIRYANPQDGDEPFTVTGRGKEGAWDLQLAGTAQATWLEFLPMAFREAEGPLPLNLRVRGSLEKPQLNGSITFAKNRLLLRMLPQEWSELVGTLKFSGSRITFENVKGFAGEGPFSLIGWVEQAGFAVPRFDLHLVGQSLDYSSQDRTMRAEVDANVNFTRRDGRTTMVDGDIALVDVTYNRDFGMLQQLAGNSRRVSRERIRRVAAGYDDIRLKIHLFSRGDIIIRNNMAEIALRADTQITGTAANPQVRGVIEATEGEIHYLGLDFEIVSGIIEFHPPSIEPFVKFTGEETIGTHLVQITLRGPVDNIQAEFTSIPGEDRKNIVCLIAYGSTCDQLRAAQEAAGIGPGIFVEQVGNLLERPIERLTGLDIVRVESVVGSTEDISRLYLGKRLSDRLEVSFITTVGESAAEQSFEAAYKLTDFLLIKGRQSTDRSSEFHFSLRFRER